MHMKKIIIVGATSGIGLEVTRCYLEKQWIVGAAGRRTEALNELQERYQSTLFVEKIDVCTEDAAERLEALISRVGGADVVLHCSGIGSQNRDLEPSIEINTAMTNVVGFTRVVDAAYNYFKRNDGGHIAVISSIAGTKGLGSAPAYSATKRFQNHYIDALAQLSNTNKDRISFTDIRPGFVATPLLGDKHYPMLMKSSFVAKRIVCAIAHKRRRVIIDRRYAVMVFFWRLIPNFIWEKMNVK